MTDFYQLRNWLKGNDDAVALINLLAGVSQVWDDLVDQDQEVSTTQISNTFVDMLVHLPRNRFYQMYFDELQPLIEAAILDWFTANTLEKGDSHSRTVAYVLRDSLTAVLIRAMALVGGFEYAAAMAPEVRRVIHDEPIADYIGGKHGES